ncbi:MAG: hypothetical protein IJN44_07740, partial [Clostridia bacterium]|nr:hypothetical protein [Clostridia bacterium]
PYVKEDCNFASWMRHWRPQPGPAAECRQPDALHPVGGILPPTRGAGASGASNSQSYIFFSKGFCVFCEGETTIPQALRTSSLYTRKPFSTRISGFFLFQREMVCQIR